MDRAYFCFEIPDLGEVRIFASHDTGTRGAADGLLAMGIQESGASRRNTIHGRRRDSVSISPNAWFQIIDRDEEDVRLFRCQ